MTRMVFGVIATLLLATAGRAEAQDLGKLQPKGEPGISGFAISPDGKTLLLGVGSLTSQAADTDDLRLYDAATHKELKRVSGVDAPSHPMYSPDGKQLIIDHWQTL